MKSKSLSSTCTKHYYTSTTLSASIGSERIIGAPAFADVQNKTPNGVGYLNAHNKAEALDPST